MKSEKYKLKECLATRSESIYDMLYIIRVYYYSPLFVFTRYFL